MAALLAILGKLVGLLAREANAFGRWARQMALLAWRAGRALGVWVLAHVTTRTLLFTASLAAFEVFTVYITRNVVTPLATSFIRTCIPEGSAGDGLVWILWDTGLNGSALFSCFVVYIANYTALWRVLDTYLRAQMVTLSTYRANLRRAKAVRDASLIK